ncbi:DUF969 domain-containing protein [Clostridium sp. SM-530-WT-3G]|uniref:DUF969 domain-containing protein n=1 Tax=Clostridium sp. SM-530-WT-3G TaxID=2725303 RepID=UPI00145CECCD|nr:DUF969 domain-containing protein [Clostridium sp. SM-530-WT-3G]NME81578.1 DUF969 domain-containing protein [Clostridium sp. SM-530-WT-3G]
MSLIGILIIVIGFILKLDTIAVVVSAGLITGLVSGMGITEILSTLGSAFINNRTTCLFMLTLPVIGLCERYGLKAKAIMLIKKANGLSTGILLSGYAFIRELTIAMGVTLGGHPQFVRPLIQPMAEGASIAKYKKIDEKDCDRIKGFSAAADNIGNFFGQNCFMANSGVLLIVGTLETIGISADALKIAQASIPIAIAAFILCVIRNIMLDRKLNAKYNSK